MPGRGLASGLGADAEALRSERAILGLRPFAKTPGSADHTLP
jgi:hypothetical protein